MVRDLQVDFKNNVSGFHPKAEKIELFNVQTQNNPFPISVMVKDKVSDAALYQFQINSEYPGSFFRGTIIVDDNLVIAVENQLYFFNLETKSIQQFTLNGYYDSFYLDGEYLFVLSNTHINCFTKDGTKVWVSDKLAVEKISIKSVTENAVEGSGKWDDDKGSVDFNISLETGICLLTKKVTKRRSMIASFFASF